MAKSGGKSKDAVNLLRISGILFGCAGLFHALRYFRHWEFRVGGFELTEMGSLIAGILLIALSISCFNASKK